MICKDGYWENDEYCDYGCDSSTGKCKSQECTSGKYKCSNSNSMLCENGFWKNDEYCTYGCIESTGKCQTCNTLQIGNKTWSPKSPMYMDWEAAKTYCSELRECGYSNWHLPTIDELRTLVKNCPETITGGTCKVTSGCLSKKCWEDCSCLDLDNLDDLKDHSKISGDYDLYWSSSTVSDDTGRAWAINFSSQDAAVQHLSKTVDSARVRCVR